MGAYIVFSLRIRQRIEPFFTTHCARLHGTWNITIIIIIIGYYRRTIIICNYVRANSILFSLCSPYLLTWRNPCPRTAITCQPNEPLLNIIPSNRSFFPSVRLFEIYIHSKLCVTRSPVRVWTAYYYIISYGRREIRYFCRSPSSASDYFIFRLRLFDVTD